MEPLKLNLQQVAEATGESLSVIHDAINAGHLKTMLIGRRRFARPEAIKSWINFLEAQSDSGHPVIYRARSAEKRGRA
jgi:hypothetical protein